MEGKVGEEKKLWFIDIHFFVSFLLFVRHSDCKRDRDRHEEGMVGMVGEGDVRNRD
jgi:hypothetical protein